MAIHISHFHASVKGRLRHAIVEVVDEAAAAVEHRLVLGFRATIGTCLAAVLELNDNVERPFDVVL